MISLTSSSPKPPKPGQKSEPGPVKKTEKELDQFRKSGSGPQVMSDDGKELNPHIPHFISAVPWFYKTDKPTLRQHSDPLKSKPSFSDIHESYIKGKPTGPAPLKFKPGACENCGSSTHKRKNCLERPRKIGAKYTNKDMKPDDYVQPVLKLDFEGKRDRWAGYDPNDYREVIQEYEEIERVKKELKSKRSEEQNKKVGPIDESDSDDEKYAETSNMPGTKFDPADQGTVRNLRIREDTAKYLLNLDLDSAFYDPKSRSMRENPLVSNPKSQFVNFKGDDVFRCGNQMAAVNEATGFTLSAHEKGIDVNLLTDPTKSELLMKQFNARKEALYDTQQQDLLQRYGGEEYLTSMNREMLFDQTEEYVEYSRSGAVVKGQERLVISSKYPEDVFPNNHTSVFGSYWSDFKWGYACCHSFIKNSYCVGLTTEETPNKHHGESKHSEKCSRKHKESPIEEIPENKIKKKSKYNVIHDIAFPTEQEMEEYHKKKTRIGDPMQFSK